MRTGDRVKIKPDAHPNNTGVVESVQHKYFTALVRWPDGRKYHRLQDLIVIKSENTD
tara:strand:- start:29 stop:199 length:171 start_codon:yes stop_codon:yes gene_type:complete